jgi:hypothetical protein
VEETEYASHWYHQDETKAKDLWEGLKAKYGKPTVSTIYNEFKAVLNAQIPPNTNPGNILDNVAACFNRIADIDSELTIPSFIQVLIIASKLSDHYKVITNRIAIAGIATLKALNVESFIKELLAIYQGPTGKPKQKDNGKEANKLSAVKRKKNNPSFKQQRQDNGDSSSKGKEKEKDRDEKKKCGKRAGKQVKARCARAEKSDSLDSDSNSDHHHSHMASVIRPPLTSPTVLQGDSQAF